MTSLGVLTPVDGTIDLEEVGAGGCADLTTVTVSRKLLDRIELLDLLLGIVLFVWVLLLLKW